MLFHKQNKFFKIDNRLTSTVTCILLFALVITPMLCLIQIQSVSAQPTTVLTPKWTRSGLGTNWEGGLVIGDVTGDGQEDIVYGGNNQLVVLNGNTGANIATYSQSRIAQFCQPQLYDVDGDGVLDILVPLYYQPGLAAVQYDGDSTLRQMWITTIQQGSDPLGSVMAKPVAGDIDGDGDLDIFLASQDVSPLGGYDGTIVRLDHNGNIIAQSFSWRACSGGLSLSDTDNDGVFEVYQGDRDMGYNDGGYGKGAKSFWADNMTERWIRLDQLTSSQSPVIADVNGDGIKDVVTGMYGTQFVYNSTNGEIIYAWTNNRDLSTHYGTTVYDIDGDGNLELLCNDGDHDDDGFSDVFDLVTGTMDAQLDMGPGVLTLNEWTGEYDLVGGDSKWSPVVADIDPTHPGMEIISVPNGTGLDGGSSWNGAIMIWSNSYESLQNITRAPGSTPGTYSTSRLGSQLAYPVVQDIDGDGLLELVTHASSGTIYAFDSMAPAPSGPERIRSEVTYFGEERLGVAEHTIAPWEPNYWTAPLVTPVSPGDNQLAVPISTSQLSFRLREHQSQSVSYTVTSSPNIGSGSGSISSGTYDWNIRSVPISGLAYDTTYKWTVTVSDGSEVTSRTYTFRTEQAPNPGNSAPNQGTPAIVSLDGLNRVSSIWQCSNQTTTDANGDNVNNIYRWTVNDDPIAQLLLPFDTRDETSTADYSGFNNDGIVRGATWVPNGKVGGAYSFDGNDDSIIVSDGGVGYFNGQNYTSNNEELGGFGNWNAVTVEAWIYLTEYKNGSAVVAKIPSYALGFSSGSTNRLYGAVWPYTGEIAEDENQASVDQMRSVSANVNIALNTWYHIAFTYQDGIGMKLFLNGAVVAQSSSSGGPLSPSRGEPLYIGRLVQPFAGMIDEIRLYNYAQPAEQIYNRYMESKDGSSSSSLFLPLGIASSGDELGCDVIPTDSYTEGTTRSISDLIGNSPPNATDLMLYPIRDRAFRLDNENLGATYTYIDTDNDAESGTQIRWYRNGALQSSLNDLLTVPASSTIIGDTWYFTVQPRDVLGGVGELQTSETITIRGNTAPSTGAPTLDSINGGTDYDNEDLVCTATTTTDPDSDLTTNIFHWIKNGVSMTNLQMPFDTEIPRLPNSNGVATDYSGYGNYGSVNGSTWVQGGVIGGALSFDGNDYITITENGNSLGSDGSWSEISVEYWVKATGATSQESVVSMHNTDYSTGGYMGSSYGIGYSSDFRAYSNRDRFFWTVYSDTGSASVQYSEYTTFGQWHHVICTYESGVGLKLYVDGLERATAELTGNINGTSDGLLFIGGTGSGSDFSGLLDEVRIYSTALSAIQVYQRYLDTMDGVSDSETITSTETSVGDTWVCQVIPNDSWQDGTIRTSTTLNVVSDGNTAPIIFSYSPLEAVVNANVGDSLEFVQFSYDPDDDELTYSWTLDSVEQSTTKDWTYMPDAASQGVHTVRVTVSDGSLTDYQDWTVNVIPPDGGFNLTILSAANGNTSPVPGTYPYAEGAAASVQAIPDAGYILNHWLLNGTNYGSTNPCTITMNDNYELQPVFVVDPTLYTLTVTIVGEGTVTKNPDQTTYTYGTDVTLTANPAEGYKFNGWSGDASGTQLTTVVEVADNMEVTATFTVDLPNLFEDGFESGDFSKWNGTSLTSGETATIVSTLAHHGTYSARFTTNGGGATERAYSYVNSGLNPQTELYVRGYFNIESGLPMLDTDDRFNFFSFLNSSSATIASAGVRRIGTSDVWSITGVAGTWNANTGPSSNQWYCIEFYIKIGAPNGALTMWIDGQVVLNQTGLNMATPISITQLRSGLVFVSNINAMVTVYSDCIAISNNYIGLEESPTTSNAYLVARGFDNSIYYREYNANNNLWGSWRALPGATIASPAACVFENNLHLVVLGIDGATLWHGYVDLQTDVFSGWQVLSGATTTAPILTSNGSVLSAVVRGLDNAIYIRCYENGAWGEWSSVSYGLTGDCLAASFVGDNLHIVAKELGGVGMFDAIVSCDGTIIREWSLLSGASESVLGLTSAVSKDYLVARGLDNVVYCRGYDVASDAWDAWFALPGATCDGVGVAVVGDKLQIIARGIDLYSMWQGSIDITSDVFSGWTLIEGATPSRPTLTS